MLILYLLSAENICNVRFMEKYLLSSCYCQSDYLCSSKKYRVLLVLLPMKGRLNGLESKLLHYFVKQKKKKG